MGTAQQEGPKRVTRRQLLGFALASVSTAGLLSAVGCSPTQQTPSATTAPTAAATKAPAPAATAAPAATSAPAAQTPAAAATSAAGKGGVLTAAGTGDIKFDPYFSFTYTWFVYGQIFNRLFDYEGQDPYVLHNQLAESFQEADKTLTVKLRQGVKFHTGAEVTAQDVVDNIARAKDKSIGHFLFAYFDPSVDSAEVVDKYTVKINYKKTYPLKLDDLSNLWLIPKANMADVGSKPVGSGPFKFGNYTPGDKLEMVKFDQYYQTGKPILNGVTVKIIPDPQARIANLQGGAVDIVDDLPLADVSRLKSEGKMQVVSTPPGGLWHCTVVNCAKKPLDNKLVRQALNYALDRDKVGKLAYFGLQPVTQARYLPEHSWYDEKAAKMYTFDLDKAKALLAQAGLPNGFETRIIVDQSAPERKALAQIWSQDLAKIGVKMNIDEFESTAAIDRYQKGDFEMTTYALGDGKLDPASGINDSSPLRTENNKANISTQPFFAEYQKLVNDGVSSIDPKVRKPIYDRIQEIWAEESWVINSAFWVKFTGLSNRVKGFRWPIDNRPYFGDASLQG